MCSALHGACQCRGWGGRGGIPAPGRAALADTGGACKAQGAWVGVPSGCPLSVDGCAHCLLLCQQSVWGKGRCQTARSCSSSCLLLLKSVGNSSHLVSSRGTCSSRGLRGARKLRHNWAIDKLSLTLSGCVWSWGKSVFGRNPASWLRVRDLVAGCAHVPRRSAAHGVKHTCSSECSCLTWCEWWGAADPWFACASQVLLLWGCSLR